MSPKVFLGVVALVIVAGLVVADQRPARAGETTTVSGYKVLDPIRHGIFFFFFLTLDEGLRSGEVVVTEAGQVQGLIRRQGVPQSHHDGAEVNRLVLVNNSKRPLLLLAGEIVTGGKQDRVIGKDRIVPPESDPVDLNVFCVEPGRRRARTMGRDQRTFRSVGGDVRSRGRSKSNASDGDDGAAFGARQGHGRQGSEPGLGGGSQTTVGDADGRGDGRIPQGGN